MGFNEEKAFKGFFGLAVGAWFISFILGICAVGGLGYLAFTVITKPELVRHWFQVVFGG